MRFSALAAAGAALFAASCAMTQWLPHSEPDDPYLWLEEVEGERALDWVRGENARSLAELEADPRYAGLYQEALAIAQNRDRLPLGSVRDGHYYNLWQDEANVHGLWRRASLQSFASGAPQWETMLDLDALSAAENVNWVWKGVACAPSGARCMLQLSDGGQDASVWREFDMATKSFVANGFMVPEAKADVAWRDEDSLLVATDWGDGTLTESGYPFIIKAWSRGQALSEAREVLRGQNTDVGVFPFAVEDVDGYRIVGAVEADTFFESTKWILGETPRRLSLPAKSTLQGLHKGQLIATLEQDWSLPGGATFPQGALVAIGESSAGDLSPAVTQLYAPGARESIEAVALTRDAVLVAGYQNVRGRILKFAYDGRAWIETSIALPPNGAVNFAGSDPGESQAFAVFEDFLTPDTLYSVDARTGTADAVRSLSAEFDAARFVSQQYEAVSKDGTRVPYFVVRARDTQMNGENPTLLYGYGGFQISMTPAYSGSIGKLWLERGGVYVLANIRGGGEFGPAWHQAGLRTQRQVVYDDFIAVAEDLIARDITTPRRLGIMGGSNGGLLMGVMLTQRPELFHAAVVQVPLLDMLRFDQLLAGASWVDEYGSPQNPEERRWLRQLSPYANLRKRDDFPTPFFVTSTKDDRVHPGHARKYAARMEALGMPFYYYENIEGGHSAAANLQETARRRSLEYTYLMRRLMD
ncbi:MAG: prolyl oligopeptidase family serine peptidase [Alphaproteobacteria bacterium]|nr:prolyl oligopeptidase family serine peptidase [Alphaproteobacteria bacterium]